VVAGLAGLLDLLFEVPYYLVGPLLELLYAPLAELYLGV
jgi:hypothetical protein